MRELQKGHIDGVDFTRIMGALGIVVFHFSCYCEPLHTWLYETANCPYGQLWVALFFAASGACVARSNTLSIWWAFYKKRWRGIFPLFFVAYCIVFALKLVLYGHWWAAIDPRTIPLTLLGIDSYFYYLQPNFSCVGEWFIGALLACYLLFPLLRQLLQRIPYTTAAILLAGCFVVPYWSWFDVEPWHNIWVCTTIFYTGMLLAQFPAVFTSKTAWAISAALTAIMIFVPMPFKTYAPLGQLIYPAISGLACFVFVTQLGAYIERPDKIRTVMQYLGKLSYPIFLVQHAVILAVLDKWTPTTVPGALGILCMNLFLTWLLADAVLTLHKKLF